MKPQVFPNEILDHSVIVQTFLLSRTKKVIYGILLLVFFLSLVTLPFIFIDVYASATGIIKPEEERVVLQSVRSGRVLFSIIQPHLYVQKGDTLLILENEGLQEKERLFLQKIIEKEAWLKDLQVLVINPNQTIQTQKYTVQQTLYKQQLREFDIRLKKAKQDLKRNKELFDNKEDWFNPMKSNSNQT